MSETCKICNTASHFLFNGMVLNKYTIKYYQCPSCFFIQTENAYWLEEAYQSAIGNFDIGLLSRNSYLKEQVSLLLNKIIKKPEAKFLDFGGGWGVFVRLMRDAGFDFYLYDKYCDNIFAKHFELGDANTNKFLAVTSFEVFEHLDEPIKEIDLMWNYSETIIFSTELQPDKAFNKTEDWWYFAPEGGQHIAFYHLKTLEKIAEKYNCKFFTNGTNLHIFTKTEIENPFKSIHKKSIIERIFTKLNSHFTKGKAKRKSLLQQDVEYIKKKLS